jgi:single-stranded-DNA-specific exonuclease
LLTTFRLSKRWVIADPITTEVQNQYPDLDPAVLQLLWNRGVKTQEEIDVFLSPDWDRDVYGPDLFLHMTEAVNRTFDALEKGQVITVHGDYDADGVCGATVLLTTLRDICRKMGFDETKLNVYIPHREKEGYGMSVKTIEHLKDHEKTDLVITVDCGISNKDAVDRGKELGIDTIICDHHAMPKELPDQAILIHPLVPGETFPNKKLCGTGVAYKFAAGMIQEARVRGVDFPEGYNKWLLDLVAIATVTDIVPIIGENRVLEKYGLVVLNKTRRVGLKKLVEISGGTFGELDTVSIGYQIGPRLNAAGRIKHATEALNLLIEEDEAKATELAMHLNQTNVERQKASQKMFEEAKQMVGELGDRKMLVVAGDGWNPGLVGLVAGKLVSEHSVPVFAVGKNGDKFVGSGRSVEGFDVTQALHAAAEHLDKFGGHPQACGFSAIGEENFANAVEAMEQFATEKITDEMLIPTLDIDARIEFDQVGWDFYELLEAFRPFGCGNKQPVFCTERAKVISFSSVGKEGAHLKLRLQSGDGTIMNAIAFRFGYWAEDLALGCEIDVAYEITLNEWNGNRELQLRLVDLKKSE